MEPVRLFNKLFTFSLLLFAVSCVTINIYFPAAAVEEAADKIVEEVWGDQTSDSQKDDAQKKEGSPQGHIRNVLQIAISTLGAVEAHAQEADINVTTPAIRALKASIQSRSESIKPYMDTGNVGISHDGLLVLRSSDNLNLKEKANLTRLLSAENSDRENLYIEIAKANNFSMDRVEDIKRIFAASWINQARAGWWIQSPDGAWIQK